ncbi:MAG: hypothetical protein J6A30_07840, partial [Ruminococcus sp.]|nr:hypothetical protein [Ruminococcus sp.]
ALGMAVAAKHNGEDNRHVVAVIGDGSMSGSPQFEKITMKRMIKRMIHQQLFPSKHELHIKNNSL